MNKSFTGYCPLQECSETISVSYIDASTLTSTSYVKGSCYCPYAARHDCGIKCPVYDAAPQTISQK